MKSKILLTVFLLLSVPFVALADDSLTENPFKEEITYLGIGLGFLFMGYMSGEFVFTGVAIIFLIMGLGGLLVYWLRKSSKETNKDDSDNEEQ